MHILISKSNVRIELVMSYNKSNLEYFKTQVELYPHEDSCSAILLSQ